MLRSFPGPTRLLKSIAILYLESPVVLAPEHASYSTVRPGLGGSWGARPARRRSSTDKTVTHAHRRKRCVVDGGTLGNSRAGDSPSGKVFHPYTHARCRTCSSALVVVQLCLYGKHFFALQARIAFTEPSGAVHPMAW